MDIHCLKTDSCVYQAVVSYGKNFEIRKNDRDFKVGDILKLVETVYSGVEMLNGKPLEFTGRSIFVEVNYILFGPIYGLHADWCIMSFTPLTLRETKLLGVNNG